MQTKGLNTFRDRLGFHNTVGPHGWLTTRAFLGECEESGWFLWVGRIIHSENGKTAMPLKGECRLFFLPTWQSAKGYSELEWVSLQSSFWRIVVKSCLNAKSLRVTYSWCNQAQEEIKRTLTCCGKEKYSHSWKGSSGEFSFPPKGRAFPPHFQNQEIKIYFRSKILRLRLQSLRSRFLNLSNFKRYELQLLYGVKAHIS